MQFDGVAIDPSQMLATAIVHNCSFVARGYAGDLKTLSSLLKRAIDHRGLSLVDIIQPCITWGNHPVSWYEERAIPIPDDHDPTDVSSALSLALETANSFPIGVLYEQLPRETFGDAYTQRMGNQPLFKLPHLDRKIVQTKLNTFRVEQTAISD